MASVPLPPSAYDRPLASFCCWFAVALGLGLVFPVGSARGQSAVVSTPPPAAEVTTLLNNAGTALDRGDYQGAVTAIDALVKQLPADLPPAETARLNAQMEPIYFDRGAAYFNLQRYPEAIAALKDYLARYPDSAQRGEVQALLADADAATGQSDDALAAYQASLRTATTDKVLNHSLTEAGKILQKRGDWAADAVMCKEFVRAHPDRPLAAALAQIGQAEVKEGKTDEAKQFLVETLKKCIDDRNRDAAEQILDQLALLCVQTTPAGPPATAAASSPAPAATPAPDPGAELDLFLGPLSADRSPTAQARVLYAKAELARLRHEPAETGRNLLAIATRFKPAALSPTLLGLVGDALVASGQPDEAASFYQTLLDDFPKDPDVGYAYAGLGEIAFQRKQFDQALGYFGDGVRQGAASSKLKDLTVGQAKTLLALNRLEEAKKLFEQAAGTHAWRGETTAYCVYSLGQIEARQGHWAEANAYFQRVYVAYQRFLPWVAKAYLGSADSLEKLGKKEGAIKTYREMLRNAKLADFTEAGEARQRLRALGAS